MKPLYLAATLALPLYLSAQPVNTWSNSGGGDWTDARDWSMGILPDSSQSISLPNNNSCVVQIDSDTAQSYPAAMSVSSLAVGGGDTLMLSDTGTNVPFSAGSLSIEAQGSAAAAVQQEGSVLVVDKTFYLAGSVYMYPWPCTPASYSVADGALFAQSLVLDGSAGNCNLTVTNSTVSISGSIDVANVTWQPSQLTLQSGTVACSDIINTAGSLSISQTGGALIVSNLFVYDGYYPRPYGSSYEHTTYSFAGGTLSASNIQIDAEWSIGSTSQSNRITNPGSFQLSGILDVGNAFEQLGQLVVAASTNYQFNSFGTLLTNLVRTNAAINFTGASTVLVFANSSSQVWSNSVALVVSGWNGYLGGGGQEQLKFGGDATGLTAAQLSQIQFANPTGLPAGTYAAVLLDTGEVVPYAPHWLQMTPQGNSLVLNWQPESVLQTSTSVIGPYVDLTGATPPYTNSCTVEPQRFFRVRLSSAGAMAKQ